MRTQQVVRYILKRSPSEIDLGVIDFKQFFFWLWIVVIKITPIEEMVRICTDTDILGLQA